MAANLPDEMVVRMRSDVLATPGWCYGVFTLLLRGVGLNYRKTMVAKELFSQRALQKGSIGSMLQILC